METLVKEERMRVNNMKVEIELTEHSARWLRSMASLGRMCDFIARVLVKCEDTLTDSDLAQECEDARKLIMEAKNPLMEIEYCRQQLMDAGVKRLWKSGTETEERGDK